VVQAVPQRGARDLRDIALTAFILGSIPFILRRPQLGVLMYVWISVMNPHRLTWSFAAQLNFAAIVAVATLAAAVFSKDLKRPPFGGLTLALVLLAAWTGLTTWFALYPDTSYARWETLLKTMLMALLIPMLFHKKEDLRLLVWVLVLSIGYYGTKGGVWTLATGGVARVYGPSGSYIEDNNAIAIAIVMMIPLMRYLQLTSPHKWVRWGLVAAMVLCGAAVLGTYSRGALLAGCAMLAFFWWKGGHKGAVLIAALLAIPIALAAMPDKWYQRMESIQTYDQDSSAAMRLNSWGTMWNLAKDRPIVGGGFEVATKAVYDRYSPDASFPPQVAHSIYFQALGEHGFVGLALYLLLLGALWRKAGALIRLARERPDLDLSWARDFGLMMQVTLVAYAVGGAFLSLVNFDVPYYLIGLVAATATVAQHELRRRGTSTAANPARADRRSLAHHAP
jgi:putative inorganic carbon (hco3(-)) transporter